MADSHLNQERARTSIACARRKYRVRNDGGLTNKLSAALVASWPGRLLSTRVPVSCSMSKMNASEPVS